MQVEHKTEKGTIRFELLAHDVFDFRIRFNRFITYRTYNSSQIKLYDAGFVLVGLTSEVTEEQGKMMVKFTGGPWSAYRDFTSHNNWFASALWSFKSLMQHLQVYESIPKRGIIDESRVGKWVVLFKEN